MNANKKRARAALDTRLASLRPTSRFAIPPKGWMRAVREALSMTRAQLAARIGIKPQSLSDLEQSEAAETITLSSLRKVAAAMDCELVYAIVPKMGLEETVQKRARKIALKELAGVSHSMGLEDQSVLDDDMEERITTFIRDTIRERDLWDQS